MPSTTREFPLSEEMKRLLNVNGAYVKGNTLFVTRTKLEPITCLYTGDPITTLEGLKQALIKSGEFDEKSIDKFLRLLTTTTSVHIV
jgi:hypothetical protein